MKIGLKNHKFQEIGGVYISFSEFDILSLKNKCYYDCNVCLNAIKIDTFMDMIVQ